MKEAIVSPDELKKLEKLAESEMIITDVIRKRENDRRQWEEFYNEHKVLKGFQRSALIKPEFVSHSKWRKFTACKTKITIKAFNPILGRNVWQEVWVDEDNVKWNKGV